ncbi:MAG: ATP-binding protein [Desertifilum sp.]|nr:ATP-binding protein [Desertifilum sp.]
MFKKATKAEIKIRLALSGASGSGKTFTALAIASHLGSNIALIDTEHGSASRYADLFDFQTCELTNHHPAKYIEAIQAAEAMGFDVIIIDSLSHAWFESLNLAGGRFDGWKNVRPLERKLIDAMLGSRAHIIATMRSKTEYVVEDHINKEGKTVKAPKKIGTAPIQASGIEYEFDLAGEMDYNHVLTISKSRCPELSDRTFLNPGKEVAEILKTWVGTGNNTDWKEQERAISWAADRMEAEILANKKPPSPYTQPYAQWKSEEDAIAWAASTLPDWPREELQLEFDQLVVPEGKKKAPLWVQWVKQQIGSSHTISAEVVSDTYREGEY